MKINTIRQWSNEVGLGKLWRGEYSVPFRGFLNQVFYPKFVSFREKLFGFYHFAPQTKALLVALKTINFINVLNLYRSSDKCFAIFHIYSLTLKTLKTSSYQTLAVQTCNLFHRAYRYLLKTKVRAFQELLNQFLSKVVPYYSFIFHLIFSQSGQPLPLQKKQVTIPSISEQHRNVCSYGTLYPSKCLWHAHSQVFSMLFSFIISLYFPSRPTAVRPRIVAVTINAVNRGVLFSMLFNMSFVRKIHISLKVLKGLPFILYSTTSIILKRLVLWLVTPANNLSINVVESTTKHSVFRGGFTQSVLPRTTTRSCVSIFEIISDYINRTTAITTTMPKRVFSLYTSKTLDQELPKLQTRQYFHSTHTGMVTKLREWVKQDCGDKHYQLTNYIYG